MLEGKAFAQGEAVDEAALASLSPRRLRQLVEQHWLKEVAQVANPEPSRKPAAVVKRPKAEAGAAGRG